MTLNVKPIFWTLGLLLYIVIVSVPWSLRESSIPALAPFFSPAQGFWQNAEVVGEFSTDILPANVKNEVQVIYDDAGIPHVFAESIEDAFFTLGYLHAKDRLFQMDFTQRAAAGKLSELIGSIAIDYDMEMRRKGMGVMIENIAKNWGPETEVGQLLLAYIEGLNSRITELTKSEYPIEYKLLSQTPELWNPEKTAAILAYLNHNLTFRHDDLNATNTLQKIGPEAYQLLFPNRNIGVHPVIPDESLFPGLITESEKIGFHENIIPGDHPVFYNSTDWSFLTMPAAHIGSNNWAIGPEKTTDGSTFVCNDPHLPLTLPAIWYECHIITPEVNLYGFSIPGVPGIFLGMSEHIALATTNVGCDYVDWYKMHWTDEKRISYAVNDKEYRLEFREEKIKNTNGKNLIQQIPYSIFGPMPYYDQSEHPLHDYSMHWRAIEPEGNLLKSLVRIFNAQNFDDFLVASDYMSDPPQNLVYGDRFGNIGLRITGSLPLRANEWDGVFLKDGRTQDSLFNQSIPLSERPLSYNPPIDFVASANQISTGEAYPYPHVGIYDKSRGTYLFNQLSGKESIDLAFLKALFSDNHSHKARQMLGVIISFLDQSKLNNEESHLLSKLQKWNHSFEADSDEAIFFKLWEEELLNTSWDEFRAPNPNNSFSKFLKPNWKTTIQLFSSNPDLEYWNMVTTDKSETVENVVLISFKIAFEKYRNWKLKYPDKSWAEFRDAYIPHLARIESFGHAFIQSGGTASALNSIKESHGPSMRMIAQFRSDERFFYSALPGGSSGNPGSPFYTHRIEQWENGEFHKAYIGREQDPLMETATATLIIRPAN